MREFEGKTALITGSSTEIGRATALEFTKRDAYVAINCVSSVEKGEAVVKEIKEAKGQALLAVADVSEEDQVISMVKQVVSETGRIDYLVNCAGFAKQSSLFELSVDAFEHTLRVNLIGTFLCIKHAALEMLKNKPDEHGIKGKIVNVASISGLENCARKDLIDYSAAKAGVVNLTKSLAKELTPQGIVINAVAPAITRTELVKNLTEEARAKAVAGSLIKRMAEPEEIAAGIIFLFSPAINYMTGEVLVIDAGYNLTQL